MYLGLNLYVTRVKAYKSNTATAVELTMAMYMNEAAQAYVFYLKERYSEALNNQIDITSRALGFNNVFYRQNTWLQQQNQQLAQENEMLRARCAGLGSTVQMYEAEVVSLKQNFEQLKEKTTVGLLCLEKEAGKQSMLFQAEIVTKQNEIKWQRNRRREAETKLAAVVEALQAANLKLAEKRKEDTELAQTKLQQHDGTKEYDVAVAKLTKMATDVLSTLEKCKKEHEEQTTMGRAEVDRLRFNLQQAKNACNSIFMSFEEQSRKLVNFENETARLKQLYRDSLVKVKNVGALETLNMKFLGDIKSLSTAVDKYSDENETLKRKLKSLEDHNDSLLKVIADNDKYKSLHADTLTELRAENKKLKDELAEKTRQYIKRTMELAKKIKV